MGAEQEAFGLFMLAAVSIILLLLAVCGAVRWLWLKARERWA